MGKNIVLLLTACVRPAGMANTKLQDFSIRRQQYVSALKYYLEETNIPIVFVENTMTDISQPFLEYVESGRLEYLLFDGNNYDVRRGKSYGEAKELLYAIQHSWLMRRCDYIVKVTGRIRVLNINSIINSNVLVGHNVFRSDFREKWVSTVTFVSTTSFLSTFLNNHAEEMTDLEEYNTIEYVLYRSLVNDLHLTKYYFIPFFTPPIIEGICATEGKPYVVKTKKNNVLDNLFYLSTLFRDRHKIINFYVFRILYYVVLSYYKIRQLGSGMA